MAEFRMRRGFVALDGPTLAEGIPLNFDGWQREDVRAVPRALNGWRLFVAELGSALRPVIRVDPSHGVPAAARRSSRLALAVATEMASRGSPGCG
jgi:hypothetical protein